MACDPEGRFRTAGRVYDDADEMDRDYAAGALTPAELKASLARALDALLEPVRAHFARCPRAAALAARVRALRVTR